MGGGDGVVVGDRGMVKGMMSVWGDVLGWYMVDWGGDGGDGYKLMYGWALVLDGGLVGVCGDGGQGIGYKIK